MDAEVGTSGKQAEEAVVAGSRRHALASAALLAMAGLRLASPAAAQARGDSQLCVNKDTQEAADECRLALIA